MEQHKGHAGDWTVPRQYRETHGGAERTDASRPSRRERERLTRRAEILEAAEELFARFGFEKTSVKRIAERAELSVGQIYNHFNGKEEIFRELFQMHLMELHARISGASCPDDPPMRRLRCRIAAVIEHFNEHRDFLRIYHNESPLALEGMIRTEIRRNRLIIADLFAEAIERGDIPRDDPHVYAACLIGSAHRLLDTLLEREAGDAFAIIPGILDTIILEPLEERRKREIDEKDGG